jgi:hypothetical protein
MTAKIKRLEQVMRWLDQVDQLPIGHPDRLRFLTQAEEVLYGPTPEERSLDLEGLLVGGSDPSAAPIN